MDTPTTAWVSGEEITAAPATAPTADDSARSVSSVLSKWLDLRTLAYSGIAIIGVVLFVVAARGKVTEIVSSEAVFFAGLSSSLAVWGVTQVYNRQHGLSQSRHELTTAIRTSDDEQVLSAVDDRAAARIDQLEAEADVPSSAVLNDALLRWYERVLRHHDVIRQVAVLRRTIDSAYERGNEFFDAQVEREDFHTDADQLAVVLDDLRRAAGSALRVDVALRERRGIESTTTQGYVSMKLNQLGEIARNLTEAIERRNHVYQLVFQGKPEDVHADRAREFFRVMTADLRKSHRTLIELLDRDRFNTRIDDLIQYDDIDPAEAGARIIRQQYQSIFGYAREARARIGQVESELEASSVHIPPAFEILLVTITQAVKLLDANWRTLMEEIGYDNGGRYRSPTVSPQVVDSAAVPDDLPELPELSDVE